MSHPFPVKLAQPALRALANKGIDSLEQLAKHTEDDIKKLHGMGPNAMSKLEEALKEAGLQFKA